MANGGLQLDHGRGHWRRRRGARGIRPQARRVKLEAPPTWPVQFFRSTLLPAAIVLLFGLALFAVSARIWLPGDMAAPAPIS